MKLLLPLFLLSTTAVATELEFKTHYLFIWAGNCTSRMIPNYERQGMPWNFAFSLASQGCSCVIDKFRENYTHDQLLALSDKEREEQSLYYAQVCSGITQEM